MQSRSNEWDNVSAFGFNAWKDGIMVRYGSFVFVSLVIMVYILWYMSTMSSDFNRLNFLMRELFHGQVDPTLLDSRVNYDCTKPKQYTLSTISQDQNALSFYSQKWTPIVFTQTLDYSLELICLTFANFSFAQNQSKYLVIFYTLIPFTYSLWCFRNGRRSVALSKYFCKEMRMFQFYLLILCVFFVFSFQPPLQEEEAKLTESTLSAKNFLNFYGKFHVTQPYACGMIIILQLLRFFFSFKITRLFGPFIKLVQISFMGLILWTFFTTLFILLMGIYLQTLLSQDQGCDGLKQCSFIMIETTVGHTRFNLLGGNWAANISFGAFTIILAAVIVNMVVAKINANYSHVQRKGLLFYYKELFELRYLYKLDPEYGYLVAFQHPFSFLLLPTLCCVKLLERRKKRILTKLTQQAYQEENALKTLRGLGKEKNGNTIKMWKCCVCVRCKKVSRREGAQLEDFNHAMLRLIYGFHLCFYVVGVFVLGFLLIPLGYVAILVTRARLLRREWSVRHRRQGVMAMHATDLDTKSLKRKAYELLLFFFTGVGQLLIRNFSDTYAFMRDCWNEQEQEKKSFESNTEHSRVPITEQQITQMVLYATRTALRIQEKKREPKPPFTFQFDPPFKNSKVYTTESLAKYSDHFIERTQYHDSQLFRRSLRTFPLANALFPNKFPSIEKLAIFAENQGRPLFSLTLRERATLPLELPLLVVAKVLKAALINIQLNERTEWQKLLSLGFLGLKRKKERLDLKIAEDWTQKVKELGEGCEDQLPISFQEKLESTVLFQFYQGLLQNKEHEFDAKEVVCTPLQKIIESTMSQKVQMRDREEAIEIVHGALIGFQKNKK